MLGLTLVRRIGKLHRKGVASRFVLGAIVVGALLCAALTQQALSAPLPYRWSASDTVTYYQEPDVFPQNLSNNKVGTEVSGGGQKSLYTTGDFTLSADSSAGPSGIHSESFVGLTPSTPQIAMYAIADGKASWNDSLTFNLTGDYTFADQLHSFVYLWLAGGGVLSGEADERVYCETAVDYSARLGSTGPVTTNSQQMDITGPGSFDQNADLNVLNALNEIPFASGLSNPWQEPSVPFQVSLHTRSYVSLRWDESHNPAPTNGTADTNFSHTLNILGIEAKDGNGVPLPPGSFTITSLSGYDYPILYADPVIAPEPSTLVLMWFGSATAGLGIYRRRRVNSVKVATSSKR